MKKKRLLIIDNFVFVNEEHYKSLLFFKIYNELAIHYDIVHVGFCRKGIKPHLNSFFNFKELPLPDSNLFYKAYNVFFISFQKVLAVRNIEADLVWTTIGNAIHYLFLFLLPLLSRRKLFFIQLGAVAVNKSKFVRAFYNLIARFNILFYKNIGLNPESSEGKLLISTYKIPKHKIVPVQLGFPDYGFSVKKFDSMNLLYIGTLNTREIWKTVIGVALFLEKCPEAKLSYDIIGNGNDIEKSRIYSEIKNYRLEDIVFYHGFLPTEEVQKRFLVSNIGVSYVPVNEYFQNSSTKTLEYLLAGMPVIATRNRVRERIVKPESGVLCEDNPESFAEGLLSLYKNRSSFDSIAIRGMYSDYTMKHAVETNYKEALDRLILK